MDMFGHGDNGEDFFDEQGHALDNAFSFVGYCDGGSFKMEPSDEDLSQNELGKLEVCLCFSCRKM